MSWGGPPAGHNPYGARAAAPGYGQQPAYQGAPPQGMYGGAPAGYAGQPAGYGQQPAGYAGQPAGYTGQPAGYAGQPAGYAGQPAGYAGQPPAGYGAQPPRNVPPPAAYQGLPQGQQRPAPTAPGYQGAPAGYGAPPAAGYGYQPAGYGAPAPNYAAPPMPPPGISPDIWQWFQAVDQDRSGKITAHELRQALMNGNSTPFNPETCRLMIGMFDRNRDGTIDVHEFSALWKYIQEWKSCFERFDTDRSGNINATELSNAFRTFGYNLSPQFSQVCVRTFDRRGTNCINFDDFIQCCVMLRSLTDSFRNKDTSQQGVINLQYEDFLKMVLDNTTAK